MDKRIRKGGPKGHYVVVAVVLAVVLSFACLGGILAKYIRSVDLPGNITFRVELAEKLELLESEAKRQTDGSYNLDEGTTVNGNTYTVMPGVDIPKDPYIVITGKTAVPARLYVEVVGTCPEGVTYEIADGWTKLDTTGANSGTVYVYDTVLHNTNTPGSISIIKNDLLYVSDHAAMAEFELSFYATLIQDDGSDAAVLYKNHYKLS